MNYSQEIALTSQNRSPYQRSYDEEDGFRTKERGMNNQKALSYSSPIKKRRYGNAWVFFWHKGEPLITVGPHWWLFLLAFITLEGLGIVCYNIMDSVGLGNLKIYALLLIFWEGFIYLLTALKNPGIVLPNEYIQSDEASTTHSMYVCNRCNIEKDANTVHCSECDICIKGMDHHCPWTGKCIGKGNLWPFYAFVGSTALYFTGLVLMLSGNPLLNGGGKDVKK